MTYLSITTNLLLHKSTFPSINFFLLFTAVTLKCDRFMREKFARQRNALSIGRRLVASPSKHECSGAVYCAVRP
jgi:hypothetical protein